MLAPDAIVAALRAQFSQRSIHAFRRFLRRHPGLRQWVLASDYNWRQPDFPQDVIAFSLLPNRHGTTALGEQMAKTFPRDFKSSRRIDAKAKGWFRQRGAGFHWCFVLENKSSVLDTPGKSRLEAARDTIKVTLDYLRAKKAPPWLVSAYAALEQESRSNSFPAHIYGDVMLLTWVYTFVVGTVLSERPLDTLEWCSDRDALTVWQNRLIFAMASTNATRWAAYRNLPLASDALVYRILDDANTATFDPIVRPADLLAGPLASWNLASNASVRGKEKYGDVYRGILAENDNICVTRIRIGREGCRVSQLHFQKFALSD